MPYTNILFKVMMQLPLTVKGINNIEGMNNIEAIKGT